MKKQLFTLCLSCAIISAHAQVHIHDNGYISVQTPETTVPTSPISINGSGLSDYYVYLKSIQSGLYIRTTGNNSNWGYSSTFENYGTQNNFMVGVRGETRTPGWTDINRGRTFGVMGLAGHATSGYNYGVFGRLHGNNYGAAVYGTSDETENGVYVDGKYAGYFRGNTKITGNLTVNGSIKGVILASSANQNAIQTLSETKDSESAVSDKIKGINVISFYKPAPTETASIANVSDTVTNIPEPTFIEMQDMSKMHYGISAEQLEEIYPDLVYENEDGSKSINYMEMIPLLLQSINELNKKIETLENLNKNFTDKTRSTGVDNLANASVVTMAQNTPNPFSNMTSIKLNIPKTANNAAIYIYDLNGKEIKRIQITERGQFSTNMSANEFSAGMYIYSLIVDNKVINTRRMIITK